MPSRSLMVIPNHYYALNRVLKTI
uniref:Uncharacterized protein n=1 Tax=Arundo donax TaxID=35708 RepID=A0A0A9EYR1_ARUDO